MPDSRMEIVGEPINVTLFAGGMPRPTFMRRRKIVFTAYVQEESVQAFLEYEDAAVRLGEQLGRLLHTLLADGRFDA